MARFTQNVKWLEQYYEDAKHMLGPHRLDKVMGYTVPSNKKALADGRITIYPDDRAVISLRTHGARPKGKQQSKTVGAILMVFAHELAHLKYWEHNEKHWQLQCYLLQNFTHTMKVLGLSDHEDYAYKEQK